MGDFVCEKCVKWVGGTGERMMEEKWKESLVEEGGRGREVKWNYAQPFMRGEKVRTTQLLFSILLCLFWVRSEFSSVKTRCVYMCSFGMSVCAFVWSGERFGRQCQMIILGDTDHRVTMKGGVWMGGRERWRWGGWCEGLSLFLSLSLVLRYFLFLSILTFLTFIFDVVVLFSSLAAPFLITVAKWEPFENSQRGIFISTVQSQRVIGWRLSLETSLTDFMTDGVNKGREREGIV